MTATTGTEVTADSRVPVPDAQGRVEYAYLDGVRGLAAVLVIVHHVALLSLYQTEGAGGWLIARIGFVIPVFFMLSGFLLYRPFVAEQHGVGRRPARYLQGRALRILPAYWIALAGAVAIPSINAGLPAADLATGDEWWRYWGLVQVYSAEGHLGGIPHTWTVDCEMVFYLLLPVLAVVAGRWGGRGERRLRIELAVAALAIVGIGVARALEFPENPVFQAQPFGTVSWFVMGMALATWTIVRPGAGAAWGLRLIGAGVAVLVGAGASGLLPLDLVFTEAQWSLEYAVNTLSGLLIVTGAVLLPASSPALAARFLRSRPVAGIGQISYGTYLWHFGLLFALHQEGAMDWLGGGNPFAVLLALTLAGSVALGWASWRLIEKPLIGWRRVRTRRGAVA